MFLMICNNVNSEKAAGLNFKRMRFKNSQLKEILIDYLINNYIVIYLNS